MERLLQEIGIHHHVRAIKSTRMSWGILWMTEEIIQILMR
jgi:hypothetical protein